MPADSFHSEVQVAERAIAQLIKQFVTILTYTVYTILFSYVSYYLQFKPTAGPYALMTSKTLWTPS